jgi:hypothetical protein
MRCSEERRVNIWLEDGKKGKRGEDEPFWRDGGERLLVLRVDLNPERTAEDELSDRSGESGERDMKREMNRGKRTQRKSQLPPLDEGREGQTYPPMKALKGKLVTPMQ